MRRALTLKDVPPLDTWPSVSPELLDSKARVIYQNRERAVRMYLEGELLIEIQKVTGVRLNHIKSLASKCLLPESDGVIKGFRALIPFAMLKPYTRQSPTKRKLAEDHGGMSGLLRKTLNQYPEIENQLCALILKKKTKNLKIHEARISGKSLHLAFLDALKKAGVTESEWPFNTQYLGRRSLYKFMNEVLDKSFGRAVQAREESAAKAHSFVGSGQKSLIHFSQPYECMQLDAYSINAFFSVDFETPEGYTTEVRLERIWLIAMICPVSNAIVSYSIVYRSQVSADDVVGVIRNAVNGQRLPELQIINKAYPENAGLPADVFQQCRGVGWGCLFLDGALAHLAEAVHDRARKAVGFSINWGPVGHFERRSKIERFFSSVSRDVFMRYPSSTGSNPQKGRVKNAEQVAVQYKLRAEEAEEVFALFVATYNATPASGNFFNSPLGVIQQFLDSDNFILRKLPPRQPGKTFIPLQVICTVRGGREHGRRPYITYLTARYTNKAMSHAGALVGQKIMLEIDTEDMTHCHAFLMDGSSLGILEAQGCWGWTKHSLRTRKIIIRLVHKGQLFLSTTSDPILAYMDFKSTVTKKKSKNNIISPKDATEATRVAKEAGLPRKLVTAKATPKAEENRLQTLNSSKPSHQHIMGPMPDLNELLKKNKY